MIKNHDISYDIVVMLLLVLNIVVAANGYATTRAVWVYSINIH